jgi:hypothetical protein
LRRFAVNRVNHRQAHGPMTNVLSEDIHSE